jgi:hypothetical protein
VPYLMAVGTTVNAIANRLQVEMWLSLSEPSKVAFLRGRRQSEWSMRG